MDSAFLTCPICYEQFDFTTHLPKMLPSCGHTICSDCLKKLLQSPNKNQRSCPIDQQPFPLELNTVDEFKANFLAKEILDTRSKKELCPEHNQKLKMICFTDEKRICINCVLNGEHHGHKVKTVKDIKFEANNQAKKIKGVLDNLDAYHSKVSQTMTETKALLLERIKRVFEATKKTITDKEQDIVYQVNSYFYNRQQKTDSLIGDGSDARINLHKHSSNLENILKDEEFLKTGEIFQAIQDHLANYNTEADLPSIEKETEVIKSRIEDVMQSLQKFQDSQAQVWSELKFDLKENTFNNLALGVFKEFDLQFNHNTDQVENVEDPFTFKSLSSLDFKYNEGKLTISTKELLEEDILDIEKWKDAKDIDLLLNHKISERDLEVLTFILRKINASGSIYFGFSSDSFSQKLLEFFAQTPLPFSRVDLALQKLDLTAQHVSGLLRKILSQFNNLQDITLLLSEATICKNALKAFLGGLFTNTTSIRSIYLDLDHTNINDDDICQFSLNLPHIKEFWLFLQRTKATNRVVEWLGKNLFQPMSGLETFKLSLRETQITDAYMENLFSRFENAKLKHLDLDFSFTKITDQTLKYLSKVMPTFAYALETFKMRLSGNNLTDDGVPLIFMILPNVTRLTLWLSDTKITDKTIELLFQNTLLSARKLNYLTLFLGNLKVTDNSISQIFEFLPKLHELELRLDSTGVTDASIAPFIIDKVPAMKELKRFKMNILDTDVSTEVYAKIQELEDMINPS